MLMLAIMGIVFTCFFVYMSNSYKSGDIISGELQKQLNEHKKIVEDVRKKYVLDIYSCILKHIDVLHMKYDQLHYIDEYGYDVYEPFLDELARFSVNVVLNKEMFDPTCINRDLTRSYSQLSNSNYSALYEYNGRIVDFFDFTISVNIHEYGKKMWLYSDDFHIYNHDISGICNPSDTEIEKIKHLNAFKIIEHIVCDLFIPVWNAQNKMSEQKIIETPLDYEKNITILLKKLGFNARTTKATGDQGADVLADKNGVTFAIQCKMYSKPVGNKAVQEANTARDFYKCDYGVVVSNADFTKSARQAANACKIILLNDTQLDKLLEVVENN